MTDDAPAYRLYTSEQAAERAGGELTAGLFDRLYTSGEVEATYIGRKLRWTDAQIGAAVAHHARHAQPAEPVQAPAPRAPRARRKTKQPATAGDAPRITSTPGRRYGVSATP